MSWSEELEFELARVYAIDLRAALDFPLRRLLILLACLPKEER